MTFHEIINIQLSHFSADGGSMTMNRYILSHNRSQRSRKWFAIIPWAVLFVLGSGAAGWEMAGGQESPLSSFGSGTIKVRLYTDYFCSPCRDMEPELEPLLLDLVKGGTIHLTFIDVPTSQHSALYARYFLSALAEKKDFDSALGTRRILFEAAGKKVTDKNQLVNLLTEKKIGLKPVDLNPVFTLWNRYLQEDQIRSTPSCVILHGDLKETHVGGLEVIKALEILRDNFGKTPAGPSKEGKSANGKKNKD
jgi:thiol:disulfide interchange protein DsbA